MNPIDTSRRYTTASISLAAFLLMKGLVLSSAKRTRGCFEFVFEDHEDSARDLEQEFVMSDYPKFDAAMRQVKARLYGD